MEDDNTDDVEYQIDLGENLSWAAEPIVLYADSLDDFTPEIQERIRNNEEDEEVNILFDFEFDEDENKYQIGIYYTKMEVTTPPVKAFFEQENQDFEISVRDDGLFDIHTDDPTNIKTLQVVSFDPETNMIIAGSPLDLLPEYYSEFDIEVN